MQMVDEIKSIRCTVAIRQSADWNSNSNETAPHYGFDPSSCPSSRSRKVRILYCKLETFLGSPINAIPHQA
ncbi:hypothetical protein RIR_jg11427.t1 [Rhizophagus irregularis DAOM 181602=DAOM 197198]|uniref:Uncharacterized protein n=1 Tax=Rhizophagus irregularis (strain DAOM 181602 / DAOM 197198 / MUCL 43194) TaxID=747089 RepID=U9T2S8_RHIID|nr:hypothetical protein RIR_jg11427.t1 [Rhizophagus irregularis DAOM 181602=DAOM 197198]